MSAQAGNGSIDLKAIFRKLLSKWWLFGITITLALAAGVAKIKTTPKSYMVEGILLMSEQKRNSFGASNEEFIKGTSYLQQSGGLEDQISILMSFANVRKTISKLDFGVAYYEKENFLMREAYTYKPFRVRLDSALQLAGVRVVIVPDIAGGTYRVKAKGKNISLYDPVQAKVSDSFVPELELDQVVRIGEPFASDHLSFTITFEEDRVYSNEVEYSFVVNTLDGLTDYYRSKTSATPQSDESNIVILTTTGEVVQKEVDFLSELMSTYIQGEQEKHDEKGVKTIKFIESQLDKSQQVLSAAESQLEGARGGGLVGEAGTSAIFNEISRLKDEESKLRGKNQYLGQLVARMSAEDSGEPSTIAASNVDAPALTNLIDQYNRDVSELAQRRLNERTQTPATIALTRKVRTERSQIIQTAQDVQRSTQSQLDQVAERIGQLNYQMNVLPSSTRKVDMATRQYELSEEINNYLMEKLYEAQIAVNSDQIDKYVVDEARKVSSKPVAPDKKTILGGALFIGLLVPVLLILVRDFFDDRIADLDELKRLTSVPVLAVIPSSKRKRVMPDEPKSLLAESFRTARINLQYLHSGTSRQVIGFTSTTSGEGKTFSAVNLASIMALSGRRVLLIDGDMRKPRLADSLGMDNEAEGLSTYLIGGAALDKVIRPTDIPGLDVILAGPIPPNPIELMEGMRMTEMMESLRTRYDRIIVDASPMGLVSEFVVLMRHLDVTLYVVRRGFTRRGALRGINELYGNGQIKQVNLLLNDVKPGSGYGQGYGYYTK